MTEEKPPRLAPPIEVTLLDEIASRLAELTEITREMYKLVKAQIPVGTVKDWRNVVTYTSPWILNFMKDYPYQPIMRLELVNEGPDPVYFTVYTTDKRYWAETMLEEAEVVTVDLKLPIIERVHFRVDKDKSARVRVIGTF